MKGRYDQEPIQSNSIRLKQYIVPDSHYIAKTKSYDVSGYDIKCIRYIETNVYIHVTLQPNTVSVIIDYYPYAEIYEHKQNFLNIKVVKPGSRFCQRGFNKLEDFAVISIYKYR